MAVFQDPIDKRGGDDVAGMGPQLRNWLAATFPNGYRVNAGADYLAGSDTDGMADRLMKRLPAASTSWRSPGHRVASWLVGCAPRGEEPAAASRRTEAGSLRHGGLRAPARIHYPLLAQFCPRRYTGFGWGQVRRSTGSRDRTLVAGEMSMSPIRVVLTVLGIVFATETAVMLGLMVLYPHGVAGWVESLLDATLLTLLIAPLVWWTIARPLRREAVAEHAKAESIVGAAAEGIITIDEQGRIEMFNRAAEGIFGYPAEEVVGHDLAILLPENLTRQYAEGLRHFLATGESPLIGRTTEVSGRKKNGRLVPVALSLTAVRVNRRWLFTGLVRDLTAVKRAEQEREARAQQQAVVVRQGQRALACDDLGQLLEEMTQCVAQTLDVDNCLILELLPDGETLLPRAGVGWSRGFLQQTAWNVTRDSSSVGSLLAEDRSRSRTSAWKSVTTVRNCSSITASPAA